MMAQNGRLDAAAADLAAHLRGRVERSWPLARLTTYRLGGPAALYVEPAGPDDLEVLGERLGSLGLGPSELDAVVVGRGSNMVVSDHGWPGLAVRLGGGFSWIEPDAGDPAAVAAGGAKPLPLLANWAARRGLAGLEWGVGVPGSVGGAVRMNAGAHGGDVAGVLDTALVMSLFGAVSEDRPAADLGFDYRRSNLTAGDVVVAARFGLRPDDPDSVRERMESYRRHRAETQPGALQNAGSTFKNPSGDSAGRLVDAAGLKGYRVGGASVSTLHANFFMAGDDATAQDVYDLVHAVRARVRDRFGVELEPEVRFVGPFDTNSELESSFGQPVRAR